MKYIITTLLILSACSSTRDPREIRIDPETVKQVDPVSTTEVAKCQIGCFRGAHKGIANTTAVQLFNYLDLSKFTSELQACVFGCYRERNKWDDLQDGLVNAANN